MSGQPTVLFLSSTHKGDLMIEQARELGYRVLLMTEESQRGENWPYHLIDEFFITPDFRRYQDVINTVTYLARGRRIDLLLPLDEFEVELVAILREHMRLPGTGVSAIRHFRDKLTMRQMAEAAGILVPAFTRILNYDELRAYFSAVQPPYMLKPRMDAGSMGIRKVYDSEQVWRALDELGDRQSYYLLEQFVPGRVYHVDSVIYRGKVVYTSVQGYARPPIDVYQGGGVFATRILPRSHPDVKAMAKLNQKVIKALGLANGVTHAEFIKAEADGQLYFLEVAARVGGAYISDLLEHATGVNPWREWMKIEHALLTDTAYTPPTSRPHYGAVLITLARTEHPDLSAYTDAEIAYRIDKPYHAGVVLVSEDAARVETLLNEYMLRFSRDFMTSVAPMDAQRTGLTG
ncbi:ATP-grasp domain-containing protein (plasmid) [Aggregatilineales bacterium SYSU G02658]